MPSPNSFSQPVGTLSKPTVNNSAFTNITAQSTCRQIEVMEDVNVVGFPTTDFFISRKLSGNSVLRRIQSGTKYIFYGPFVFGQLAGQIKTNTGTTTFVQDEG